VATLSHREAILGQVAHNWDEEFDAIVGRLNMPPEEIAKLMLNSIPRKHFYDELLGPFYDTEGVRQMLGNVSRQAIHDRVKNGTLLQVQTSDRVSLYPAFQFAGSSIAPGFKSVLQIFRGLSVDGWTIATWFRTPAQTLQGLTPLDVLSPEQASKKHRKYSVSLADVASLATETARRWETP
jgi:hypothetical protein